MDTMNRIELIQVKGFKSIADLTISQSTPFMVFAGPNGAGKSNLMDALAFFGEIIRLGIDQALRDFGGFAQVHCFKYRKANSRTACFRIHIILSGVGFKYEIHISDMDTLPVLQETLHVNEVLFVKRNNEVVYIKSTDTEELNPINNYPRFLSALVLVSNSHLYAFLSNIRVFRFDPLSAKEPDSSTTDASALDCHGRNIATMLSELEKDNDFRSQVMEWMELLVPGMEYVSTEKQRLDGTTLMTFKETGLKNRFPARLISDGTIYVLCIMTAVLSRSRQKGLTIIEEPERGIHPQGITQLVELIRSHSSLEHPVMITTHSESVVRASHENELWLVNKTGGKTQVKNAGRSAIPLQNINLDKAWLMNFFDGGLPW